MPARAKNDVYLTDKPSSALPDDGFFFVLVRSQKDVEMVKGLIKRHSAREDVGSHLSSYMGALYKDHVFWALKVCVELQQQIFRADDGDSRATKA